MILINRLRGDISVSVSSCLRPPADQSENRDVTTPLLKSIRPEAPPPDQSEQTRCDISRPSSFCSLSCRLAENQLPVRFNDLTEPPYVCVLCVRAESGSVCSDLSCTHTHFCSQLSHRSIIYKLTIVDIIRSDVIFYFLSVF